MNRRKFLNTTLLGACFTQLVGHCAEPGVELATPVFVTQSLLGPTGTIGNDGPAGTYCPDGALGVHGPVGRFGVIGPCGSVGPEGF